MPNRNPGPIGRRAFLTGSGAAAGALALSGCSVFGGGTPTTRTVVMQAPPPVDPLSTLTAITRLHLARVEAALAAVAADQASVALLNQIRSDRAAHLDILLSEAARSAGSVIDSSSSSPAASTPQISVSADPPTAIAAIRTDAETAQLQFTDGVSATGRYRAAIFASISACLATHRSVLA